MVAMVSLPASTVVNSVAAAEAASEEAAALEATEDAAAEEAVLEEPPQAVRARAATVRPAAAIKLRRVIFFIFKHSSVDCIILQLPTRCDSSKLWGVNLV